MSDDTTEDDAPKEKTANETGKLRRFHGFTFDERVYLGLGAINIHSNKPNESGDQGRILLQISFILMF